MTKAALHILFDRVRMTSPALGPAPPAPEFSPLASARPAPQQRDNSLAQNSDTRRPRFTEDGVHKTP